MCPLRWKWPKDPQKYSEEEKRRIMGKLVEILIKTTFQTHFYKWNRKIFKQREGGPIGLRASGTVAKLIMELWLREVRKRLETAGFKVWLMEKYVDDVLLVCSMAKKGDRIVKGKLERSCEAFSKDQKEKIKHIQRRKTGQSNSE